MIRQIDFEERLKGTVYGLAVGDVYGAPIEGYHYKKIAERFPTRGGETLPADYRPFDTRSRLAGIHTDDTQQALVLLDAYANTESIGDFHNRIRELYAAGKGCWRGTGKNFDAVVDKLDRQRQSGIAQAVSSDSLGLGANMRVAPLGVLCSRLELRDYVYAATEVTHHNPLAKISAYATALVCRYLADVGAPRSLDLSSFAEHLVSDIHREETKLKNETPLFSINSTLTGATFGAAAKKESASRFVRGTGRLLQSRYGLDVHPTKGFGPTGHAISLFCFLKYLFDPQKALSATLCLGGDADTLGAITGAFCGSLYGEAAFSPCLREIKHFDVIEGCVKAALNRRRFDLIAAERRITQEEKSVLRR